MKIIPALHITPRAQAWLETGGTGKVLSVFESVCNVLNERGDLLALATPSIPRGPFTVGIPTEYAPLTRWITTGKAVQISAMGLQIEERFVSSMGAEIWSPVPDWVTIDAENRAGLTQQLAAFEWPPLDSLFAVSGAGESSVIPLVEALVAAVVAAELPAPPVGERLEGKMDAPSLRTAVASLAGLGPGLTPAGDDFLVGFMHGLWATRGMEKAQILSQEIAATAGPQTTTLSRAWLETAAAGEAAQPWHHLVQAGSEAVKVSEAMAEILALGDTSGAAALWGFWLLLSAPPS